MYNKIKIDNRLESGHSIFSLLEGHMLAFYLSAIELPEDKRKFEIIYEKYRRLMFKIAFDILKSSEEAEDAVHEAFTRVTRLMHKINDAESSRTKNYLVIITRNIALTIRKNQTKIEETHTPIEQPDKAVVEEILVDKESYRSLVDAIYSLPGIYAEVLLLRYDNGYSMEEVAKILNISHSNAKKTLQRARKALNVKLDGKGDDYERRSFRENLKTGTGLRPRDQGPIN